MTRYRLIVALSALVILGCEKKEEATPEPTPESPTETKPEAATPPPKEEAKRGLADPSNDPAFVKEVEAVLKCEWKNEHLPEHCPAYQAFIKDGRKRLKPHEDTLLNMLRDENPHVRTIAITSLLISGEKFKTDPKLAGLVLDAVDKESREWLGQPLGGLAGMIKPSANLSDRVLKVIATHPLESTRNEAIKFHFKYPFTPQQLTFLKKRFDADKSVMVKRSILSSIKYGGAKEQKPELCDYLWNIASDRAKHPQLAVHAAYQAVRWNRDGGCPKESGLILSMIEKFAKDGSTVKDNTPNSDEVLNEVKLAGLLQTLLWKESMPKDTLPRVRKASETILKNTQHQSQVRAEALRILASTEGGAMKLAKKYKDNKELPISNVAKRVIDGKIKPESK